MRLLDAWKSRQNAAAGTLGNGANVLGPITVGDGATIGTGAMVTKDVEAGATVIDTGFMSNKVLAPRGKKKS